MSNKINPRIEQAIKESIAETRIVTVKVADLQEALGDVSNVDLVSECDYVAEGTVYDVWGVYGGDDFRLRLRKA